MREDGLNAKYPVGGSFPARRTGIVKREALSEALPRPSFLAPTPFAACHDASCHSQPEEDRENPLGTRCPRVSPTAPFSTFQHLSAAKKNSPAAATAFRHPPSLGCGPANAPRADCAQRTQPTLIKLCIGAGWRRWPTNRKQPTGKANAATPEYPQSAKNTGQYRAIRTNTQ